MSDTIVRNRKGDTLDKITEQNIDHMRKCGCWGVPQIGCYALYMGLSDGGFAIYEPDDPNLIGVPKDEIEDWKRNKR